MNRALLFKPRKVTKIDYNISICCSLGSCNIIPYFNVIFLGSAKLVFRFVMQAITNQIMKCDECKKREHVNSRHVNPLGLRLCIANLTYFYMMFSPVWV